MCASSPDESGREALDWALESLIQDGDEFVVYRGVEEDILGQLAASPRQDFNLLFLEKDHSLIRDEARELMRQIEEKSVEFDPDRKVLYSFFASYNNPCSQLSLILEYVPGKITDTLDRLIALYRPDSVVVGTRGRK